ncbi:hypothetical protein ACFQ1E_07660 [Sphingomonas canadensis]|uniref:Uncharacterized protein n=1 Tax=Sphingomonas canadensis TaxID=1219257 RepID=A0ABW3H9U8_9SPHN|nr:hypothetical protein [Sphingomonas canadensis]MCW3835912.1 hypothetical protein [Sphingomonas canadensis]
MNAISDCSSGSTSLQNADSPHLVVDHRQIALGAATLGKLRPEKPAMPRRGRLCSPRFDGGGFGKTIQ